MEQKSTTNSGENESRDETGLLDVLELLMETKKAKTTADLVKYAAQYGAPQAEQRLRVLEAEGIPLGLAYDAISVHLRILEHKRSNQMVASSRGKKVGIVLHVPHHVLDLFMPVAKVELLHPGEHPLHGPLHDYEGKIIKGARACRTAAAGMEVLVFEAFREGGTLYVDASVADVLEPKLLPAGITLLAHLRPHRNPQDIAFTPGSEVSFI
jgi:hypothetical protein